MPKKLRVTRDVTPAECSWLTATVRKGTVLEVFEGYTYGCITPAGVAMKAVQESGFSELPQTALGPVLESV